MSTLLEKVAESVAPSVDPVVYTEYIDNLPVTDRSCLIQVPQHASHILPILTSAPLGFAFLEFYGSGAAPVYTFNYDLSQTSPPIPVPAQARHFRLQNNTGQDASFKIPFQLSL